MLPLSVNLNTTYSSASINFLIYTPKYYLFTLPSYCGPSHSNLPYFIRYNLPFSEKFNYSTYSYYQSRNMNIYYKNSSFYTDRCYIYTTDDNYDITLKYRKLYLNPGVSIVCGTGCEFIGIDSNNYTVCACTNFNVTGISQPYYVTLSEMSFPQEISGNNLNLIKCVHIAFNKRNLYSSIIYSIVKNFGFWVFASFLVIAINLSILFVHIDASLLQKENNFNFMSKIAYNDAQFFTNRLTPFDENKSSIIDTNRESNIIPMRKK